MSIGWPALLRKEYLPALLAAVWTILFAVELILPVSYWADAAAFYGTVAWVGLSIVQLLRKRRPWLWAAMAATLTAVILAAIPLRMRVLAAAVQKGRPLIERIEAFAEKNGRPPKDLTELGPGAHELTKTGIPACPSFEYSTGSTDTWSHWPGLTEPRPWLLQMPCNLWPGFFIYYGAVKQCSEYYECVDGWVLGRP